MIKKYLGLSLITASALVMGCSSSSKSNGGGDDTLVTVPATVTYPDGVVPALSITELAVNSTELTQLAAAVTRAGLADTLNATDSTFTVFAPTDAAFAALPAGTVDNLTDAELADLLNYHVVSGGLDAAGVIGGVGKSVTTAQGGNLAITSDETDPDNIVYSIGGAVISSTDLYATNGIVHLIDTVLVPPAAPVEDADGDGVADADDNCPAVANADQADADGNGTGDACEQTGGGETQTTGDMGPAEIALTNAGAAAFLDGFVTAYSTGTLETSAFTIFAPSDATLGGAAVDKAVVDNHLIETGALNAAALGALTEVSTFGGGGPYAVVSDAAGNVVSVGGFAVTEISASGSVVYTIDGILQ